MNNNILQSIVENCPDQEFVIADGFDDCVIGYEESSGRLIYSTIECVRTLQADGMSEEDALDYFYYNVQGAYVGDLTPIWCNDML